MEENVMTHSELVNRAAKWLKNFIHCRVVLVEMDALTASGERPDAIGWVFNQSILVECKASRSDFYADRKKRARHDGYDALGAWRFYLTPPGLLKPEEIIDRWGLYEVHGRKIVFAGGNEYNNTSHPFESCRDSEVAMLVSALSRIRQNQGQTKWINQCKIQKQLQKTATNGQTFGSLKS